MSFLIAAAVWAMLMRFVLGATLVGLILLFMVPGSATGAIMRYTGRGVGRKTAAGLACGAALLGCLGGDLGAMVWKVWAAGYEPVTLLSRPEAVLAGMFTWDKLLLYAAAAYLAWRITRISHRIPLRKKPGGAPPSV